VCCEEVDVRLPTSALLLSAAAATSAAQIAAAAKPKPSFDEIVRMRVVHVVPGMDKVVARRNMVYRTVGEQRLEMDAYVPPGLAEAERRPAVVFVHGGPVAPQLRPKDWGGYVSYGELTAASGLVGITFNHRFYDPERPDEPAADIAALIEHVRANARTLHVDPDRLAVWAFSGGGLFLGPFLAERPPCVRAVVSYYATLDIQALQPGQPDTMGAEMRRRFSPVAHLGPGSRPLPPILVARLGQDNPLLNETVDRFVREALLRNVPLDLLNHPEGHHGFDVLDDDARSREIIARTLEFLKARLGN
jgi:acetyl esterase/lipase